MPRVPEYNTLQKRADLQRKMWALATCDVTLFALVSPFSEDSQTQYVTNNSHVKKRSKKGRECVEIRMVELKHDLHHALMANKFEQALEFYFPLARLVGVA